MGVCVSLYVCMYVCMYVFIYVCIYISVSFFVFRGKGGLGITVEDEGGKFVVRAMPRSKWNTPSQVHTDSLIEKYCIKFILNKE